MTDITELAQSLKAAAEKASNGDWVKESGDGWEACCSANDQANGGFIIAHFVGPDAAENREFVQAANPANVLALVEALESEKRICATWRKTAEANSEKLEKAQQQMTESENRVRKQNRHICELFDDNTALRQRIAGLEARTVKLPDLRQIVSGDRYVWSDGVYNYSQDVKVALAAAGIKVEAE
ncbi:TPA: ead/Ea22-like family protein [Klebsiella pneumoniae]|uniref:ead/Ea22-like family protein n=1 Tax=Klebsiella pneumoniae TaxID=573 RepID=UPI00148F0F69|nr:ead/Ea22-like family protein [Klebsiella pneumoniae]NON12416.1 ead/Ea22-like family protein [Klebsiella pneumoniae]NON52720.1 ead/Ea22-like family protein [Klebsiella pneumoniae]HBW3599357.1 ead/Ea22-like family protein [Klebsiella pneumoniae]HBW3643265.1 ead/Ea22-like family protein [Klebsiella pneumoniae]HBY8448733.1 ead/Ea22-like family protein [Klebsiella pneumoniae]